MPMWIPRLDGAPGEPLFRQIIQSLADDIAAGRLRAGDALPPHRDLADKLGVARGTVARAYDEAAKLGLVRGRVGHGTEVLAPDGGQRPFSPLLEPPTVFSDLTMQLPLSGIDPDPADALRELAVRPDRMALLRYQSNAGLRRHRQLGVAWAERFGVASTEERVLPCAGAQHALFLCFAHLARPGEAVMVEQWSYPGLHGIAETLGVRLVPVAVDAHGATAEAITAACRRHRPRALYCMPTVHNPLGFVVPDARRDEWVALARRHDFQIIEDDAYRLLLERAPAPIANRAPERTYFIASTSKALGAGLRVAFLVAPRDALPALARHLWATHWMVGALGLELVAIWLRDGEADRAIARKRREAHARQRVADKLFRGRAVLAHPQALHLWLWLPSELDAEQVAAQARAHGLGVTPSTSFWMGRGRARPALRVALGGIDRRADLRVALAQLDGLLGERALVRSPTRPSAC